MSRCYPYPPPGYEKKAPQLSADIAQPHKDKKDRHKHKDKKKKKKKDGDANGDTHDKDSSRPSKQPRTALINDLLQPKEEKQNGKVRDVLPSGVGSSLTGKGELRDGGSNKASSQVQRTVSERIAIPAAAAAAPILPPVAAAAPILPPAAAATAAAPILPPAATAAAPPPVVLEPSSQQQLYSKQEQPNGKALEAKPVLVLPPESSERSTEPISSRPGSTNIIIQPTLQPSSNNLDSHHQRQSPEAGAGAAAAAPACEMLVLKPPSAWSDVPDEDWLFAAGSRSRPTLGSHPKPKAEVERGASRTTEGEASLQVWAEPVFLPSCDLYALPYVVPY